MNTGYFVLGVLVIGSWVLGSVYLLELPLYCLRDAFSSSYLRSLYSVLETMYWVLGRGYCVVCIG